MIAAVTYLVLMLAVIGVASAMIFSGPKEKPGEDKDETTGSEKS